MGRPPLKRKGVRMDIGAYMQIPDLEELLKKNGIYIPRLRGIRLMKDEKREDYYFSSEASICSDLCEAWPKFSTNPSMMVSSPRTRCLRKRYVTGERFSEDARVKWDNLHGWKRRALKYAIKAKHKHEKAQVDMWNKYAGRPDIVYVHARIGGGNWPYYYQELIGKPWFIEKIDDSFDETYCDIYIKLDTVVQAEEKGE